MTKNARAVWHLEEALLQKGVTDPTELTIASFYIDSGDDVISFGTFSRICTDAEKAGVMAMLDHRVEYRRSDLPPELGKRLNYNKPTKNNKARYDLVKPRVYGIISKKALKDFRRSYTKKAKV